MFGKRFQLNEDTIAIVEEVGKHMPGGFLIYKSDGEDLIYANKAAMSIFGCRDNDEFRELTGYNFKGIPHPEDYETVRKTIDRQVDSNDERLNSVEYRIVRKDGSIRWVEDYGHCTETEAYGDIHYVFITDITEKHREIELIEQNKEQQDKMITALASDYRCVYHADLDANIATCYRSDPTDYDQSKEGEQFPYLERFTHYAESYVAPSFREGFIEFIDPENVRKSLAEETIIAYRYLVQRDGREYYEMIRMAGVRHPKDRDDNMVHAVGLGLTIIDAEMREAMTRNRTLVEALAAAEEANKAKTSFLSSMSHEIRTPMNAILGFDSLALRRDDLDDEMRDYLEKIGSSARHLLDLINDILDMSRIEAGRLVLRKEPFSLRDMLNQIDAMIMSQCREKGIRYEGKMKGVVGDSFVGDSMKLKQVFLNILSNAVKFTERNGYIRASVEQINNFGNQTTLKFRVEDTGIGMDKEFLPKLFDSFSQENSGGNNKYGSTGLGMAITKSIVELMDGNISVESEKGKGSVFTVIVTLKNAETSGSREDTEGAPEKGRAELAGRRILLAEDIFINAEIVKKILSVKGAEIDAAANGRIALDKFRESGEDYYDAVLMDVSMPEMDGLEATRRIRALDRQDAKRVPVIAMTANAFDEDVKRSLQSGMNAHLSKPVEAEQLYRTLEEYIWEYDRIREGEAPEE